MSITIKNPQKNYMELSEKMRKLLVMSLYDTILSQGWDEYEDYNGNLRTRKKDIEEVAYKLSINKISCTY